MGNINIILFTCFVYQWLKNTWIEWGGLQKCGLLACYSSFSHAFTFHVAFLAVSSRAVAACWFLRDELQMCDGLHRPSSGPWGVLACQGWNAPAHLTLAERKQIPLALNTEIGPYRLEPLESCELCLWVEHLIQQILWDSHNTYSRGPWE